MRRLLVVSALSFSASVAASESSSDEVRKVSDAEQGKLDSAFLARYTENEVKQNCVGLYDVALKGDVNTAIIEIGQNGGYNLLPQAVQDPYNNYRWTIDLFLPKEISEEEMTMLREKLTDYCEKKGGTKDDVLLRRSCGLHRTKRLDEVIWPE